MSLSQVRGYVCIGRFVLLWGWQGQACSPLGWLVGNELGQASAKPQLLRTRAEGIPQIQTAPRRLGCETGLPYHHLPLQRSSRLAHTLVVWEMGYSGCRVSQASRSSSPGVSTRRPLLFGEVANPWCSLSNDNFRGREQPLMKQEAPTYILSCLFQLGMSSITPHVL